MTDTHVVSALKEKRGRLAGELKAAQWRVIALRTDLASVDDCLRLFARNIDPESIPAKVTFDKNPAGLRKGVATRTALEILREAGEALSGQELAACILQRHGRPLEARSMLMLVKAIHGNFARRDDGLVEFDRSTCPGKWRLIPKTP